MKNFVPHFSAATFPCQIDNRLSDYLMPSLKCTGELSKYREGPAKRYLYQNYFLSVLFSILYAVGRERNTIKDHISTMYPRYLHTNDVRLYLK
jgi:hypothetical protein